MSHAVPGVTCFAPRGLVCTVDHLASSAGAAALRAGGSAADAAIAANAVLAVTAPHMCGLGGDLFALVHDAPSRSGGRTGDDGPHSGGTPVALNASGRAGSGADPARLRAEGHRTMPFQNDIRSVTVPGCVDGWLALHSRYGRLPLADLLADAIHYAENGFPASPLLVRQQGYPDVPNGLITAADPALGPGAANDPARPRGMAGELVCRPGVGRALRAVVAGGRAGFYEGEFGEGLLALGAGEYLPEDLRRPNADWTSPLHVRAFGHDVWTPPPNSQGYLLLLALGIADGLDLPDDPADPLWAHLLVEAARVAGHDRLDVLHEHAVAPLDTIADRRALIHPDRRAHVRTHAAAGDTTYLCAVDADGMGVSLIQSNAAGFGSLLAEPRTGINLHNRGMGFSLTPAHPAEYAPGRRPPHTLAPALVTRPDGTLRAVAGTMGGDAQPQIMLQILTRLLRHNQDPGTAIAAPRWRLSPGDTCFDTWTTDPSVELEHPTWTSGLRTRGHQVTEAPDLNYGHAHLIDIRPNGVRAGAADPRALISTATGH